MKKIISLVLSLTLMLLAVTALASCGNDIEKDASAQIDLVNELLEKTVAQKTVTTTTHELGTLTLTSVATLSVGTVDGAKAATYVNVYEQLSDFDKGVNANHITTKTSKLWYIEGRGTCENGKNKWDAEGEDFSPKAGDIKIQFDKKSANSATYDAETETLVITYTKENANKLLSNFLGEDYEITSGIVVTVTTSGGKISSLQMEYYSLEHDLIIDEDQTTDEDLVAIPEMKVTIKTEYSYDLVDITLD